MPRQTLLHVSRRPWSDLRVTLAYHHVRSGRLDTHSTSRPERAYLNARSNDSSARRCPRKSWLLSRVRSALLKILHRWPASNLGIEGTFKSHRSRWDKSSVVRGTCWSHDVASDELIASHLARDIVMQPRGYIFYATTRCLPHSSGITREITISSNYAQRWVSLDHVDQARWYAHSKVREERERENIWYILYI